jgi:hypothetical protein
MSDTNNFKKTIQDAFEPEYMDKFPQSARSALDIMSKMILDSDTPADVALAVSLGLAYSMYASNDPERTLAIVMGAASKIAEKIDEKVGEDSPLKDSAGNNFFKKMRESIK